MEKINFNLTQDDDGYPPVSVESLWARKKEDFYVIDNIPFFTVDVAFGDLVKAKPDMDGNLWFAGLIESSAHSLIRVVFLDLKKKDWVIEKLKSLGCATEKMDDFNLLAVDVSEKIDRILVLEFLKEGLSLGYLDYEEAIIR
ncbi:hypothetical protein IGB42_04273 [Andreprevotia sp. IGB-42]|uniref:DUF4265 domain-containing protein n=1 Tax=Andreprevotia sp. IGB-42 TaxID=2497473 RepID=UPI00135A0529|nr:DUF4265 domain-containing protein [Andreprevotia sp. IGB-42]KAF0811251.1 hypothetical protein IGB42_04273 [Andreprevotia sp. IGB-42]